MLTLGDPKPWLEAHYGIALHAGVQICIWTKRALRNKGVCYKQKFYGIECHRCAQVSPLLAWCDQACVFCWRPSDWMNFEEVKPENVAKPEVIIPQLVEERRRLLSGIGGAHDVAKRLFEESYERFPSHWAISLSGEPTLYPFLPEMVIQLKNHEEVKSVFVVTNGQHPEMIEKMRDLNALPTQLYVSLAAWDEASFIAINRPKRKDGWQRLKKTLGLLSHLPCRTVVRLTLIKGLNTHARSHARFATLLDRALPDFIEVKSYIAIGKSRERLGPENMLSFAEVKEQVNHLLQHLTAFEPIAYDEGSRIVLLARKNPRFDRWILPRRND